MFMLIVMLMLAVSVVGRWGNLQNASLLRVFGTGSTVSAARAASRFYYFFFTRNVTNVLLNNVDFLFVFVFMHWVVYYIHRLLCLFGF